MAFTQHPILFEDSWLMVVNKPDGTLSHPNEKTASDSSRRRCAFEGPYEFRERRFDTPNGPIWLIHRLDQETSGVLLAAKKAETARKCRVCFEEHQVQKTYLALVEGRLAPSSGVWQDHLEKRTAAGMVRSRVVRGRPSNAELRYALRSVLTAPHRLQAESENRKSTRATRKALARRDIENAARTLSLLDITLCTGRTHQIRVQAAARGHPVVGDRVYGNFQLNRQMRQGFGLRRLFLHAARLAFRHPETHQSLKLEAPLPSDLQDCLEGLS